MVSPVIRPCTCRTTLLKLHCPAYVPSGLTGTLQVPSVLDKTPLVRRSVNAWFAAQREPDLSEERSSCSPTNVRVTGVCALLCWQSSERANALAVKKGPPLVTFASELDFRAQSGCTSAFEMPHEMLVRPLRRFFRHVMAAGQGAAGG